MGPEAAHSVSRRISSFSARWSAGLAAAVAAVYSASMIDCMVWTSPKHSVKVALSLVAHGALRRRDQSLHLARRLLWISASTDSPMRWVRTSISPASLGA